MPTNKDLKRLVRARMAKTGESYTAARAQVVGSPLRPLPDDYAKIAGYADETVKDKTGRAWPEWVEVLDELGATEMDHKDIAIWVNEQIDHAWWAQGITVGYERLVGRREPGQNCNGSFQASKSSTIPCSAQVAHQLLCDLGTDQDWLAGLSFRGATPPKSVRFDGSDGSRASLWITDKGPEKCGVSVSHEGLPSQDLVATTKVAWADRLAQLKKQAKDGAST